MHTALDMLLHISFPCAHIYLGRLMTPDLVTRVEKGMLHMMQTEDAVTSEACLSKSWQ